MHSRGSCDCNASLVNRKNGNWGLWSFTELSCCRLCSSCWKISRQKWGLQQPAKSQPSAKSWALTRYSCPACHYSYPLLPSHHTKIKARYLLQVQCIAPYQLLYFYLNYILHFIFTNSGTYVPKLVPSSHLNRQTIAVHLLLLCENVYGCPPQPNYEYKSIPVQSYLDK